jgi:hypothetical protein
MHKPLSTYTTVVVALLVAAAFAVPALAGNGGRPGGGVTPQITIAAINGLAMSSPQAPTPAYQDTVTWATAVPSLAGWQTPEVVLSCYQDVDGNGVIDTTLGGPDIVYSWIDSPGATFSFSGQGQTSRWSLRGGGAATCRADLDAYGWKSGKSTVQVLATTGNIPVSG